MGFMCFFFHILFHEPWPQLYDLELWNAWNHGESQIHQVSMGQLKFLNHRKHKKLIYLEDVEPKWTKETWILVGLEPRNTWEVS